MSESKNIDPVHTDDEHKAALMRQRTHGVGAAGAKMGLAALAGEAKDGDSESKVADAKGFLCFHIIAVP